VGRNVGDGTDRMCLFTRMGTAMRSKLNSTRVVLTLCIYILGCLLKDIAVPGAASAQGEIKRESENAYHMCKWMLDVRM